MVTFLFYASFIIILRNIFRIGYLGSSLSKEEKIKKQTLKNVEEKWDGDVAKFQKYSNFVQVFSTGFTIFYYIASTIVMGSTFMIYFGALLVALSVARFKYLSNYFLVEKTKKSMSSAFLFPLSVIFACIYIVFVL